MDEGLRTLQEILGMLGYIVRFVGFLMIGFGIGRFTLDAYNKGNWQVQIALALGFFGLVIGLTHFSTAGSAGAFALGAGAAFFMSGRAEKKEEASEKKK